MSKTITSPLVPAAAVIPIGQLHNLDLAKEPIDAFEIALGGRDAMIASLSIDGTPEIRDLVSLLLDPTYDGRSLGYLAREVNITLTDLLRAYRNCVLAKAQIAAVRSIATKLPAVVDDVMRRSAPYEEACDACLATPGQMTVPKTKKNPNPDPPTIPCTVCRGVGKVLRLPELDRQRLALEIGELVKSPKGGTTLLQQFNLGASGSVGDTGKGSLERLQQAVTSVLYSRGAVIDVDPVEPGHD